MLTDEGKSRGIILVRAGTKPKRRRFTIGHELGHFLIPTHLGNRQCTSADLRESRRDVAQRRQEAEANRFSAGLLMPKKWFVKDIDRLGDPDVAHFPVLSEKYGASLEAVVNRFVELTDAKCAIVFSQNGIVRYVRRVPLFPRLDVDRNDRLPPSCASVRAPQDLLHTASTWSELDGSVWLSNNWGTQSSIILEQSLRQAGGFQITLLLAQTSNTGDDDDEEDNLEEKWTPRFHR